MSRNKILKLVLFILLLILTSCNGEKNGNGGGEFSIGGLVSDLSGTLKLQNNGKDDLTITNNGVYEFDTKILHGNPYDVIVKEHPKSQKCTVNNGAGKINDSDVTNIDVICKGVYPVGGSVIGLFGTLILQNNGKDDLIISADGSFVFSEKLPEGDSYIASIKSQPQNQTCSINNESGAINEADITNISLECKKNVIVIYFDNIIYSNDSTEPVIVYDDEFKLGTPCGFMGTRNGLSLSIEPSYIEDKQSGSASFRVTYDDERESWAGIYILNNKDDDSDCYWEDNPTDKLDGMTTLSFFAKCETGTVVVKEMGMGTEDDSSGKNKIYKETLTTEWKEFTIDLSGRDLSAISGTFYFAIEGSDN